ncbi:alpha/beta hydrolase fold family protein [Methyloversatilis sp. RAC08]|uniref:alpha/beta hydrolase n=1 Tax=Methyloversatilis sp. RAC08 TaxID=1842540 RepID=UPI00083D35BA|nr:alpha/beta hydrolase [Methyloversatilis sp. RAC08]AOF83853.1 alpha/beta hydrolase fold family protein [Methyloversatilis sp. RAC08]
MQAIGALILALGVLFITSDSEAGTLRERLAERTEQRRAASGTVAGLPAGTRVERDVSYGDHADQRLDVYIPADARAAPMLFLVHGGGWRRGDKTHGRLIDNKLAHWLPAGVVIVSINYRMLPEADVLTQRDDVVAALAAVQTRAHEWGGDASRVVLMGHSAGAHLVALVAAAPRDARVSQPWLGSVLLDSGALDVERLMAERHHSLFDDAFGKDRAFWISTSPVRQLAAPVARWLAVCSSQRRQACDQVKAFALRVRETGGRIDELPLAKSHGAINEELGLPGAYTERVDDFLREVGALAR